MDKKNEGTIGCKNRSPKIKEIIIKAIKTFIIMIVFLLEIG